MPVIDLLSEAPPLLVWGVTLLVVLPIAHNLFQSFSLSSLPTVNQKSLWDVSGSKARANFMMNGRAIYQEAVKKFPNKPYRAHTEIGFMTILPPSMANEVKNDARLSHNQHIFNVSHSFLSMHMMFYIDLNVFPVDDGRLPRIRRLPC